MTVYEKSTLTEIARSKHYADINKWIESVIDSCENVAHEIAARNLVGNFSKTLYKKCGHEISSRISSKLYQRIDDKFWTRLESLETKLNNESTILRP